ncbi:hypothetical protein [Piscinibacter sakaiensis]|uniref:hypothetical protein n=1 Tax=Piscinibacter sakaiensis TaxID=1547922 RepID=UPI003AAC5D2B
MASTSLMSTRMISSDPSLGLIAFLAEHPDAIAVFAASILGAPGGHHLDRDQLGRSRMGADSNNKPPAKTPPTKAGFRGWMAR